MTAGKLKAPFLCGVLGQCNISVHGKLASWMLWILHGGPMLISTHTPQKKSHFNLPPVIKKNMAVLWSS